jgi:hypothetical protein
VADFVGLIPKNFINGLLGPDSSLQLLHLEFLLGELLLFFDVGIVEHLQRFDVFGEGGSFRDNSFEFVVLLEEGL